MSLRQGCAMVGKQSLLAALLGTALIVLPAQLNADPPKNGEIKGYEVRIDPSIKILPEVKNGTDPKCPPSEVKILPEIKPGGEVKNGGGDTKPADTKPNGGEAKNGGDTKSVPPGTPVNITVSQAQPASPAVSIALGKREGMATPCRKGCTHTGGGNIDVAQPSSDTIVITMTGVAVAYCGHGGASASIEHSLQQAFEITFDNPKVKAAKLTIEGRLVGLLRSTCKGTAAEVTNACVRIAGPRGGTSLSMPTHIVAHGKNLSINDREGPVSMAVVPGAYTLTQTFTMTAASVRSLFAKAPSAEFAPDPALDPLWISNKEPFKGAAKKDFGFQITIKVADDTPTP